MDNLDSASNISEDGHSESNTSSISGLTLYEEELNNVRQLIQTNSKEIYKNKSLTTLVSTYENRIKNLNVELQNALKLNEKYKNDLFSLEHNNDYQKFKTLLEKNTQLQTDLNLANEFIKSFANSEINEKSNNFNLYKQMIHWKNEFLHLSTKLDEETMMKIKLRREKDDLLCGLDTKSNTINELKKKITEQHMEKQEVIKNSLKISNELSAVKTQLKYIQQSETWYKSQLHECQGIKNKLSEEISTLKTSCISKEQQLQYLQSELKDIKEKFNDDKQMLIKEKENLLKTMNNIKEKSPTVIVKEVNVRSESNLEIENYKLFINDINQELERFKNAFNEQNDSFNCITKQNSDLLSRNVVLQKTLMEKEATIELLNNLKNSYEMKLQLFVDNVDLLKNEITKLKNEKDNLQLNLQSAQFENSKTEETIKSVRLNFNKFLQRYNTLREELHEREKSILHLEKEKQELYMNQNWQICEIEEIKQNLADIKEKYKNVLEENNKQKIEINNIKSSSIIKFNNFNVTCEEGRNNELLSVIIEFLSKSAQNEIDEDTYLKYCKYYEDEIANNICLCVENPHCSNKERNELNDEKLVSIKYNLGKFILNYLELIANHFRKEECNTSMNIFFDKIGELLLNTYVKKLNCPNAQEIIVSTQRIKVPKMLQDKINKLQYKYKMLCNRTDECDNLLSILQNQTESNMNCFKVNKKLFKDVHQLEEAIKILKLEQEEKLKRNERIHHTLLRKLKEHMKGRTLAEKNWDYIKQMYESLNNDYNRMSVQIKEKDKEIDSLKKIIDSCGQSHLEKNKTNQSKNEELHKVSSETSDLAKNSQAHSKSIHLNSGQDSLYQLQQNLNCVLNEKNFLQRLCTDLRHALEITRNQNMVYLEHIKLYQSERQLSSFPTNLSSPKKFDDLHVCQLLNLNKKLREADVFSNLRYNISVLKSDISYLKCHVQDKMTADT